MLQFDSPRGQKFSPAEMLRREIAAADLANTEKLLKRLAGTPDEQKRKRLLGLS